MAVLGCRKWPFNWGAAAFKGWRGDVIRSLRSDPGLEGYRCGPDVSLPAHSEPLGSAWLRLPVLPRATCT